MAEVWSEMRFSSIWRPLPPPSWILSDMSSGGKSCLGTLFSVSASNLVRIRSVHKWPSYDRLNNFKMAAAAILNLLPVSVFVIGSFGVVVVDVSVKFQS